MAVIVVMAATRVNTACWLPNTQSLTWSLFDNAFCSLLPKLPLQLQSCSIDVDLEVWTLPSKQDDSRITEGQARHTPPIDSSDLALKSDDRSSWKTQRFSVSNNVGL